MVVVGGVALFLASMVGILVAMGLAGAAHRRSVHEADTATAAGQGWSVEHGGSPWFAPRSDVRGRSQGWSFLVQRSFPTPRSRTSPGSAQVLLYYRAREEVPAEQWRSSRPDEVIHALPDWHGQLLRILGVLRLDTAWHGDGRQGLRAWVGRWILIEEIESYVDAMVLVAEELRTDGLVEPI